ncbi:MAG: 23S rRNA (pseudouridine(1915)-N(3))-methyltransferase RlmH [Eubacterium sp.]|nr:23S rRNA (pseudouridine(1915)-N(3))-methyltransferase RlmH [Eubacterium sp.]
MKVTVIAVGRLKEKYLTEGCAEYLKRLHTFAKVNIVEINEYRCSENPLPAEIETVKSKEGEAILAKLPKGAYVIPLCIEGKQLSSEALSAQVSNTAIQGFSELVFIIGGSFGLSDAVKQRGELCLSFGKLTLPHQLMRLVLLEQIYRAFAIANHTKYHK